MSIFFWRKATVSEVIERWVPADVQAQYGISPAKQALPLIKQWNDLPAEERAKASAAFVNDRLSNPDDEWWP